MGVTEVWSDLRYRCDTLIARFTGPTWGTPGADRTQVGSMLAPWTLLSGYTNLKTQLFYHWDVLHHADEYKISNRLYQQNGPCRQVKIHKISISYGLLKVCSDVAIKIITANHLAKYHYKYLSYLVFSLFLFKCGFLRVISQEVCPPR